MFTIVIDSREQLPYEFNNSIVAPLETGDYSILGMEKKITIERKSKQDAYYTIGKGRSRFCRELERMKFYDFKMIVIECSMGNFLIQPKYGGLHPNSAINSLLAWCIRYGVHVIWADNRILARGLVYRILEKYWKENRERK